MSYMLTPIMTSPALALWTGSNPYPTINSKAWEYHKGYDHYYHSIFNIKVDLTHLKDFTLKIE